MMTSMFRFEQGNTAMKMQAAVLVLFLAILVPVETIAVTNAPVQLPGVVRSSPPVYLMEDHSAGLIVWHALRITNATLVHVDAHDDCRIVADTKLASLQGLLADGNYREISRLSDTRSMLNFEVKEDDFLFDLGNFIYPCLVDGTLTNVFWVIPEKTLSETRNRKLQAHVHKVLNAESNTFKIFPGGFSCRVGNAGFTVTTLDGLPVMGRGALLDIDTDFFALPEALSETHITGELQWDPADVCRRLKKNVPEPAVVTVASSVFGGYLPVTFRFVSDGCFDFFASGEYPQEAADLLKAVITLRTTSTMPVLPAGVSRAAYIPAMEYLKAMAAIMDGNRASAVKNITSAAVACPVYSKAMLDFAEAFLYAGDKQSAQEMLDLFEKTNGKEAYGSIAIKIRLFLLGNNVEEAGKLADKLTEWNSNPFTMMHKAGVLERKGQYADAIAVYSDILKTTPNNALALYNMGVVYEKQGKTDDAVKLYRLAIQARPDMAQAYDNLGNLLVCGHSNAEAVPVLITAARLNPLSAAARNNLGLALARQGKHEEATVQFRHALRLSAGIAAIHANLAASLIETGNKDEARKHCEQALKIRPDWPEVLELLKKTGNQ